MKGSLIASSGTLEGIRALVAEFYGGGTIALIEQGARLWSVHTARGPMSTVVRRKGGRYRFEALPVESCATPWLETRK